MNMLSPYDRKNTKRKKMSSQDVSMTAKGGSANHGGSSTQVSSGEVHIANN